MFYQTPSHPGRGTIREGSKEAEKNGTLDSTSLEKITTRVSTMEALRTVAVFQVDTLGGSNTHQPAVDSGSGEHAGGNTAFPDFRHRSCSSHTPCWCGSLCFRAAVCVVILCGLSDRSVVRPSVNTRPWTCRVRITLSALSGESGAEEPRRGVCSRSTPR